ncbi:MAG: alpha/beta hydrolase [Granulosicoccus sp.]|nr:alpha/beta hydrolase [Granulosicoccus sp.]
MTVNAAESDDEDLSFAFTLDAPGEKILIDGFRLHVDCMGQGDTTVLFEAGLGGSSLEWKPVQQLIAGRARACTYDRAGYGWSDPSPFPRHARAMAREADLLLDKINADGPLILVGHSFGGFVVRQLAQRRVSNMVGMVLVDASHEDQLERLEAAGGKSMMPRGSNFYISPASVPESLPRDLQRKIQAFARMRKSYAALHAEMTYFRESADQVKQDRQLQEFPLVVISRGRDLYAQGDEGRQKTAIWKELQQDLGAISAQSTFVLAEGSGHHVHADDPQLVASVIESILDSLQ